MAEVGIGNIDNKASDLRFRLIAELGNLLGYSSVHLHGDQMLESLHSKRIIFAVDHTSDRSIPVAMGALASMYDLRVPYISELDKEFPTNKIMDVMGRKHFQPLDYIKTESNDWQSEKFNPENLEPVKRALQEGAAVEIAANPIKKEYDYILPSHGSKGPVWLAHEANAIIVPVSVNTHEPELVGVPKAARRQSLTKQLHRPNVDIVFGDPIELKDLPDGNGKITKDNIHRLRIEADYVLQKVAENLPQEQRGVWNTKPKLSLESFGGKSPLEMLAARATGK